tara:strand:+ start:234 stop:965 length:732 start_codon:yes stop_codon:yes gene_type:complete
MGLSDLFGDIKKGIYDFSSNILGDDFSSYITDFDFSDPSKTGLIEDALKIFATTDDKGNVNYNTQAIGAGLGALLPFILPKSFTESATPPMGYQGSIPQYKATRTRLPLDDTDRRPGSGGRRYFTDTTFTPMNKGGLAGGIANIAPRPKYNIGGGVPNMSSQYLDSMQDGMADTIPATIDNKDPAALSGGEFVIAADVVSGLGNGNSDAGAKELYNMMDRVRKARTGTTQQGKQIDPRQMMRA